MKLGNVSFGLGSLSLVNSGVKKAVVVAEPQLVALSTKGGFSITAPASTALNVASGDNIMFVNNIAWAENAIATRDEQIVAVAAENGLDLDNEVDAKTLLDGITRWFVGKAYAKKSKTGAQVMTPVRMTNEEKQELLNSQIDDIVAANRDALIEKFGLDTSASDDEIKSHITIDDIATPEVPAYVGAKLAANGNAQGTGVKLSFSDTSTWEQLKSDLEDKTSVKRVYTIDTKNPIKEVMNNGFEDVEVVLYPIGDYTDEKPMRVAKKSADVEAESVDMSNAAM
jgi:hypothetical protein